MTEIEMDSIIAILKPSGLLSPNCSTKEDISHTIFENNNVRKEILKWAISQFSEVYSAEIQNSQDIEHELLRKLMVLGFLENSTKWTFLKGQMGKEEQIKIYKKLFMALELIKSNHETRLLTGDKENTSLEEEGFAYDKHAFLVTKRNNRKKQNQDFDLTKAKDTLKRCDDVLASVRSMKTLEHEESRLSDGMAPSTEVNIDKLRNAIDSASLVLCEKQHSSSGNPSPIKLDAAVVGELHGSLQLISKVISPTSESAVVRVVDSKKTLQGIEDIQKKSLIYKIIY